MKKKPRKTKNQTTKHLGFDVESLEKKQMLAGNVTATITGAGHLVINGDAGNNEITVEVDSAGNVDITALDGETITDNGFSSSQVTGDVRINMRGGNDTVYLVGTDSTIPIDDVRMVGGSGNDYLAANGLDGMSGNVTMTGGSGADSLAFKYSSISGNVTLSGGGGNDYLTVDNSNGPGKLNVRAGGGNDAVEVTNSAFSGALNVATGGGDDVAYLYSNLNEDVRLTLGGGNDAAYLSNSSSKYFGTAIGGGGTDSITFDHSVNYKAFENVTDNTI